jgi:hypothetical protein
VTATASAPPPINRQPFEFERLSVAMPEQTHNDLTGHLIRDDRQEDLCFATYKPSSGTLRWTGLLRTVVLPEDGERAVHGNASFTGDYVVRAAGLAAARGEGLALLHSHPHGTGWQQMSDPDADAERSYAQLVHAITGIPLLGLTLAGDTRTWSARAWDSHGTVRWCESTRVIGAHLRVCWNERLRATPQVQDSQVRTVSAWGETTQADLARLRVLVIGTGSVGLDVAQRLTAGGLEYAAVMDFDIVEVKNLDRMIGATRDDAEAIRPKTQVAARLMHQAATARDPQIIEHDLSVCEPAGQQAALDYDVIFSCVDRPWPRAVLNVLAYADLIPVIDGGISIDTFSPDAGGGMRNATWRTHVLRPGRPCLVCNEQLNPADVTIDRQGLLDDPEYIAGAGRGLPSARTWPPCPRASAPASSASSSPSPSRRPDAARPGTSATPLTAVGWSCSTTPVLLIARGSTPPLVTTAAT